MEFTQLCHTTAVYSLELSSNHRRAAAVPPPCRRRAAAVAAAGLAESGGGVFMTAAKKKPPLMIHDRQRLKWEGSNFPVSTTHPCPLLYSVLLCL